MSFFEFGGHSPYDAQYDNFRVRMDFGIAAATTDPRAFAVVTGITDGDRQRVVRRRVTKRRRHGRANGPRVVKVKLIEAWR